MEYAVDLARPTPPTEVRALAYTALVGEPQVGDRVLLNASALLRGLGHRRPGLRRGRAGPAARRSRRLGAGHIVKARYTPQQQMFLAVDEQDSPHHDVMTGAAGGRRRPPGPARRGRRPALGPARGARRHPHRRAAGPGRLPHDRRRGPAAGLLAQRRHASTEQGWLAGTVTVGQAYGGQHEAVTLHSGLLAARHVLGADVAVVIQGPGNVGTGTPWGYTGVAAGEALNAVGTLGGRGVAALRVSDADARDRHRGISHHSTHGIRSDLPRRRPTCRCPRGRRRTSASWSAEQAGRLVARGRRARSCCARWSPTASTTALRAVPVRLSTMGRGLDEDHAAFLYSAAAGRWAARLLAGPLLSSGAGRA